MASQRARTRNVARRLLAVLAFLVCASAHQAAQASAVDPSIQAAAIAACFAGDHALDRAAGSVDCPQRDAALAPQELTILGPQEPEGPEHPEGAAALDAAFLGLAVSCAPLRPVTRQRLRAAAAAWKAQVLIASALPRGPPLQRG